MSNMVRTKWAAVGAAVAVTLGAGGVSLTQAALSSGDKPVYVALDAPCRLVDTRPAPNNVGPKNTPIGAGDTNAYEIQVTGANGNCTGPLAIPDAAVAVATNVTAIAPVATSTGRSFFTVYPADATRPTTSNLNFLNGQAPVPNKVDVGLSATGKIKIFNNEGTAHAAVDVFGYYIDHNHDDRYYTKNQTSALIDNKLLTKADSSTVYTQDEVDELIARTRPVAVFAQSAFSFSPGSPNIRNVPVTVTVPAQPRPGVVLVNASTELVNAFAEPATVHCDVVDLTVNPNAVVVGGAWWEGPAGGNHGDASAISVTKGFNAGPNLPFTVGLVCNTESVAVQFVYARITATFVPNP